MYVTSIHACLLPPPSFADIPYLSCHDSIQAGPLSTLQQSMFAQTLALKDGSQRLNIEDTQYSRHASLLLLWPASSTFIIILLIMMPQ